MIYYDWLRGFLRKAALFYQSQDDRHERLYQKTEREYDPTVGEHFTFRHSKSQERDSPDDAYYLEYQHHSALILGIQDFIRIKRCRNAIRAQKKNFKDVLKERLISPKDHEVDELWFNLTITNTEEKIQALRLLDYRSYVHTPHWQRVRAAMLLIHRAVCQEVSHFDKNESWYFGDWENDIYVHHLSYDNLGCERYKDLTLLCSEHHTLWQSNMKQYGEPRLEIAFRSGLGYPQSPT